VVRQRGPEGALADRRDVRSDAHVPRRLDGERAARQSERHRELRHPPAAARGSRPHRPARRRRVRHPRAQVLAVIHGRKYWPSSPGWDAQGVNLQTVICRTDPDAGGTTGLSAIIVERGTPGISYRFIDKTGHRLAANAEVVFDNARVPADNLLPGAAGNGDFVINRNFAWSGPVAAIAAVGVARAAYEAALTWTKSTTSGALKPTINFQNVGYVLGDVAAKIEMCRYFAWRAADYLDKHDQHAELVGAMSKIQVTEMMVDAVYKCMQIVGVNSLESTYVFGKLLREASVLPIYDGGNMGMQRRRVHGIIAHEDFNPRAIMDDEFIEFTKSMESIDTVVPDIQAPVGAPA
jgi:alkylation response protein AidB-like acyl-CoA dehydrogenase